MENNKSQNITSNVEEVNEIKNEDYSHNIKTENDEPGLSVNEIVSINTEFDTFADNEKVYRKYRLRSRKTKRIKNEEMEPDLKDKDKTVDLTCPHCYYIFENLKSLRGHVRNSHTKACVRFSCALCQDVFNSNNELVAHKSVHEDEKRIFTCEYCKLAFSDHCDYLIHEIIHKNPSMYKCIECDLPFQTSTGYQYHIVRHFNKPETCNICSKVVNGPFNLRKHLNDYHIQHEKKVICVECGKICKNTNYYKYHLTSHTGVKLFQCLYCGKAFTTSLQRKIHTRYHTNERPFKCSICDRSFIQATDYQRHCNTHLRDKPFQCAVCSKKFIHKYSLVMHMRSHSKTNLIPCPECDRKFTSHGNLKAHTIYKHVSERHYKCDTCNMTFKHNLSLERHFRSISHKNKFYGNKNKILNGSDNTTMYNSPQP